MIPFLTFNSLLVDASLILLLILKFVVRIYTLKVPRRTDFRRTGWRITFPIAAAVPFLCKYLLELAEQNQKYESRMSAGTLSFIITILCFNFIIILTMCLGELSTVANRIKFSRAIYELSDDKIEEEDGEEESKREIETYMKSRTYMSLGKNLLHQRKKWRNREEEEDDDDEEEESDEVALFTTTTTTTKKKHKTPTLKGYAKVWLFLNFMYRVWRHAFVARLTITYQSAWELYFDILGVHTSFGILTFNGIFWLVALTKLIGIHNNSLVAEDVIIFNSEIIISILFYHIPLFIYYYKTSSIKFEIIKDFWYVPFLTLMFQVGVVVETWYLVGQRSISTSVLSLSSLFACIIWLTLTIYISSISIKVKGVSNDKKAIPKTHQMVRNIFDNSTTGSGDEDDEENLY